MRKKIIPALIISMAAAAAFYTASGVSAQTRDGQYPVVVQKIADKFGLKVEDVKAVFDQTRTEEEANRQAKFESRLTTLVTEGKITEGQKQLILAKHKELEATRKSQRESLKTLSSEEKKATFLKEKEELTSWATQNHIDVSLIRGFDGPQGRGHGPRPM